MEGKPNQRLSLYACPHTCSALAAFSRPPHDIEPNEHTRHGDHSPAGKRGPPRNPARGTRVRAFPANQPRGLLHFSSTTSPTTSPITSKVVCFLSSSSAACGGAARRHHTRTPRGRRGRACSPRPPTDRRALERHSGHARATDPAFWQTTERIDSKRRSADPIPCGCVRHFFRHGGRERERRVSVYEEHQASALATVRRGGRALRAAPARSVRLASHLHKSYEGCRRPSLLMLTEAIGARPSTRAYRRAYPSASASRTCATLLSPGAALRLRHF